MTGHQTYSGQTQVEAIGRQNGQARPPGLRQPPAGEAGARTPLAQDLLLGVAAGVAATALTGAVDRLLDRFVSESQKRRERRVRDGSPHELAGPIFGEKLLGRTLSRREKRRAQRLFGVGYGIGWGMIYAAVRRAMPQASRAAGLPFALPFFALCDGAIAPLLRLTPRLTKVPWQLNVKEMINHVAWTAGAEMVFRLGRSMTR